MADPVTIGLASVQLIGGIAGMLGAAAAKKRAIRARQQAMMSLLSEMAREERTIQERNALALMSQSGYLRDALEAQGAGLGAAMAQAGVYNSSATAGAIQKQARDNATILADIASKLDTELAQIRSKNRQFIAQQQLGFAREDYQTAQAEEAATLQGIMMGLEALAKSIPSKKAPTSTSTPATTRGTAPPSTQPYTMPNRPMELPGWDLSLNTKANSGNISEYLRRAFQPYTIQNVGPAMNGNYNSTLQMPTGWWMRGPKKPNKPLFELPRW